MRMRTFGYQGLALFTLSIAGSYVGVSLERVNRERAELGSQVALLEGLISAIDSDLRAWEHAMETTEAGISSAKLLVSAIKSGALPAAGEFAVAVNARAWAVLPSGNQELFDELTVTGEFGAIQNASLRKMIVQYYGLIEDEHRAGEGTGRLRRSYLSAVRAAVDHDNANALVGLCCGPGVYDEDAVASVDERAVLNGFREDEEIGMALLVLQFQLTLQAVRINTMTRASDTVVAAIEAELAALR